MYEPFALSYNLVEAAPASTIKVNVNTGVMEFLDCGPGNFCLYSNGVVLVAATIQLNEEWEPCVAEDKAIYHGLKLVATFGYERIEVESDSLLVIQALRSGKRGYSDFSLIIDDVLALVNSFNFNLLLGLLLSIPETM